MKFESYPFEKLNNLLQDITPNQHYLPLSLTIGEPQFNTPGFILEALTDNIREFSKYPKTRGETYLREAILHYNKKRFDIDLIDAQIVPTFGTREVLFNFPQYLLHDIKHPKMVFPNPFYQIYEGAAIASRAEVVYLELNASNGFLPEIDTKKLQDADLVILNSPNNPTGSVMSIGLLQEWVRLALRYDFVLMNDECYIDLYADTPLPSILNASMEVGNSEFKNVIALNSLSKRSSAPGLRSGFLAGDKTILESYAEYRTYVGCASPLPLQRAASIAWNDSEHVGIFREKYKKNMELAKEILGIDITQATFYVWLQVKDDIIFTKEAYERYNLKVLPGSFLGRDGVGSGYVRLALVYEPAIIEEALGRIKELLKDRME
ncbi:MAG: succinyldiaminopimelate transaminase [Campylobacterales bacterium]|nr:succinyldiaminopimelate transaminase [Campylobacterales bacterium]